MTQRIIARRFGLIKFERQCENFDFSQDEFDDLLVIGRQAVQTLRADGVNLKHDYGEDALCAVITARSLDITGDLNINLVHVVYRILEKEIEGNFNFSGSDIELSED